MRAVVPSSAIASSIPCSASTVIRMRFNRIAGPRWLSRRASAQGSGWVASGDRSGRQSDRARRDPVAVLIGLRRLDDPQRVREIPAPGGRRAPYVPPAATRLTPPLRCFLAQAGQHDVGAALLRAGAARTSFEILAEMIDADREAPSVCASAFNTFIIAWPAALELSLTHVMKPAEAAIVSITISPSGSPNSSSIEA